MYVESRKQSINAKHIHLKQTINTSNIQHSGKYPTTRIYKLSINTTSSNRRQKQTQLTPINNPQSKTIHIGHQTKTNSNKTHPTMQTSNTP